MTWRNCNALAPVLRLDNNSLLVSGESYGGGDEGGDGT